MRAIQLLKVVGMILLWLTPKQFHAQNSSDLESLQNQLTSFEVSSAEKVQVNRNSTNKSGTLIFFICTDCLDNQQIDKKKGFIKNLLSQGTSVVEIQLSPLFSGERGLNFSEISFPDSSFENENSSTAGLNNSLITKTNLRNIESKDLHTIVTPGEESEMFFRIMDAGDENLLFSYNKLGQQNFVGNFLSYSSFLNPQPSPNLAKINLPSKIQVAVVNKKIGTISKSYIDRVKNIGEVQTTVMPKSNSPQGNGKVVESSSPKESGDKICLKENIKFDITDSDLSHFSSEAPDYMTPGVILKIDDFKNGRSNTQVFDPSKRNPVILGSGNQTKIVENPTAISLISAAKDISNNLRQDFANNTGGNISAKMKVVESLTDFSIALSGRYDSKVAQVGMGMGMSSSNQHQRNYIMIDFIQKDFTVRAGPAGTTNSFIKENADEGEYAIVKSVSYGRRAVLLIETSFTKDELKANLNIDYEDVSQSASAEMALNYLKSDKNLNMNIFYYGGNVASNSEAVVEQLKNSESAEPFINSLKTNLKDRFASAQPISFQLYSLNGEPLAVNTRFSTVKTTCTPKKPDYKLKVTIVDFICGHNRDGGDNPDDLEVRQLANYSIDGNLVPAETHYNLPPMYKENEPILYNTVVLLKNTSENQFHLGKGESKPVMNSAVYTIPGDLIDSPNQEFYIHNYIKEHSNDNLVLSNEKLFINIRSLLKELAIMGMQNTDKLSDANLKIDGDFVEDNTGFKMFGDIPLRQTKGMSSDHALEGLIRASKGDAEAGSWITFEFVED